MVSSPPTQTQPPDIQTLWRQCDRFLSGHGVETAREALENLAAAVSDEERQDQYGSGPLVEDFESELAALLGKEAAVFLPSGTMTQQIALRIWCERSGRHTVGFHPTCHLEVHEQKAYSLLHGLYGRLLGSRHRLLTVDDLDAAHEPLGALLLELPQREIGGQLPAWEDLQAQLAWAHEHGVPVHMDGARLWESAPFYDRSHAEIARGFDSVYVSFYKGLGGIGGAALAGPADVIAEARVWAKRHGGSLFRLFPYVVSARKRLGERLDRFPAYHTRAAAVAAALESVPGIKVKPSPPHTNMMHVYFEGEREALLAASAEIAEGERVGLIQWLRETETPGYVMTEVTIGDAAEALTDREIKDYAVRLMTR